MLDLQDRVVSTPKRPRLVQREETAHRAAPCSGACVLEERVDDQFITMLNAYRGSGGLARAPEVRALFKRCGGPDVATLVKWIVRREVICFEWESQPWLPLFQFDRLHLRPDARLRPLFSELTCIYDQWDIANWFARPNAWLLERTPVDALPSDFSAVLDAARAERFVANG